MIETLVSDWGSEMDRFKRFLIRNFEVVLVAMVVASVIAIHFAIASKGAFLSFYYLPVLLAGYFLGKRQAVTSAILSIAAVVVLVMLNPAPFYGQNGTQLSLFLDIMG